MRHNRLKEALSSQPAAYGPFVTIASPPLVELMGYAGFDFVIIDSEHGSMGFESVENLVRAADSVGITSIVRVPKNDEAYILKALDTGAGGVMVPHIEDRGAAEEAVAASRFAPEGRRGVSPYTRAASYSHIEKEKYFRLANEEVMVVLQIEGVRGLENLDEVLGVKGIDIIFIGPYDLSQSLGVPGAIRDRRVAEAMARVVDKCRGRGVTVGTFADTPEMAREWVGRGVRFIGYSVDTGIILDKCREIVRELRPVG